MRLFKILISGQANTGKDTLKNICINSLKIQDNYISLAFADPMKRIACEMYPNLDRSWLYGPSHLRNNVIDGATDLSGNPLTVRQLLLDLGKFGRKYNQDTWINATDQKIDKTKHILIPDCRFINEFNYAVKNEFYLIRIRRPSNEYKIDDISETEMNQVEDAKFNTVILNDGSLENLEYKTKYVMKDIIKHASFGIK